MRSHFAYQPGHCSPDPDLHSQLSLSCPPLQLPVAPLAYLFPGFGDAFDNVGDALNDFEGPPSHPLSTSATTIPAVGHEHPLRNIASHHNIERTNGPSPTVYLLTPQPPVSTDAHGALPAMQCHNPPQNASMNQAPQYGNANYHTSTSLSAAMQNAQVNRSPSSVQPSARQQGQPANQYHNHIITHPLEPQAVHRSMLSQEPPQSAPQQHAQPPFIPANIPQANRIQAPLIEPHPLSPSFGGKFKLIHHPMSEKDISGLSMSTMSSLQRLFMDFEYRDLSADFMKTLVPSDAGYLRDYLHALNAARFESAKRLHKQWSAVVRARAERAACLDENGDPVGWQPDANEVLGGSYSEVCMLDREARRVVEQAPSNVGPLPLVQWDFVQLRQIRGPSSREWEEFVIDAVGDLRKVRDGIEKTAKQRQKTIDQDEDSEEDDLVITGSRVRSDAEIQVDLRQKRQGQRSTTSLSGQLRPAAAVTKRKASDGHPGGATHTAKKPKRAAKNMKSKAPKSNIKNKGTKKGGKGKASLQDPSQIGAAGSSSPIGVNPPPLSDYPVDDFGTSTTATVPDKYTQMPAAQTSTGTSGNLKTTSQCKQETDYPKLFSALNQANHQNIASAMANPTNGDPNTTTQPNIPIADYLDLFSAFQQANAENTAGASTNGANNDITSAPQTRSEVTHYAGLDRNNLKPIFPSSVKQVTHNTGHSGHTLIAQPNNPYLSYLTSNFGTQIESATSHNISNNSGTTNDSSVPAAKLAQKKKNQWSNEGLTERWNNLKDQANAQTPVSEQHVHSVSASQRSLSPSYQTFWQRDGRSSQQGAHCSETEIISSRPTLVSQNTIPLAQQTPPQFNGIGIQHDEQQSGQGTDTPEIQIIGGQSFTEQLEGNTDAEDDEDYGDLFDD
ncbi:hypothetical protein B0J12DRAFT_777836 [Macrophomina phaseolina]|uniref:Uncharacterized protein n=1 Tax=Macrophomina phaseolina TaxID=35725 RepID=A0ABQ8GF93_9PEZI|nr:hypothetical protein B0J12DRAFT_777836 [Macrophomina phaseolina]